MRLDSIPTFDYQEYRLNVMFDSYKWDLQANEQSTISDKVLLLEQDEAKFLEEHAVKLYHETIAMENELKSNPKLAIKLGISENMVEALCDCNYAPSSHMRFMRFDFHPVLLNGKGFPLHACTDSWKVSEVNSDVPAGYPEASILPRLAQPYFEGYSQYGCFGSVFKRKISKLVPKGKNIAYLHDTHTVEDYQILHYLGDLMESSGYKSMYASPRHIIWEDGEAPDIGGIMRHYPVEWMECTSDIDWKGFVNAKTPSCNHPIALLTQSKRLPLVWDELGLNIPTWRSLLPSTKCPTVFDSQTGWVLKPAFGRVGEGINIPGTVSKLEDEAIRNAAKNDPSQWVLQEMFESAPIDDMHVAVGVFVMDGEYAGMFSRISSAPRIDEDASEIPVLVKSNV